MIYTKREGIKDVQKLADAVIEQLERWDRGWDQGRYRDDDPIQGLGFHSARQRFNANVEAAFRISWEFSE